MSNIERIVIMSSYINSYVHKGLVVRETDKAALITMPRDMVGGTWFTWLPKSMLKDLFCLEFFI